MPEGMRKLVRDLRRVPVAIGDGVKRPLPSEEKPLQKMGKKLVAARALAGGARPRRGRPRREVARRRRAAAVRARRAARHGPLVRALAEEETILAADVARAGSTAATPVTQPPGRSSASLGMPSASVVPSATPGP